MVSRDMFQICHSMITKIARSIIGFLKNQMQLQKGYDLMVWPLNGIHTCEVGKGLKGDDWATGPDFIECTWCVHV